MHQGQVLVDNDDKADGILATAILMKMPSEQEGGQRG
jgi:hypothetical protein